MRIAKPLVFLLICLLFNSEPLVAHPVSQGALTATINAQHIQLDATVALEEILVVHAYSGVKTPLDNTALSAHGDYLLAHITLKADGQTIAGRVVATPSQSADRLHYQLDYPLKTPAQHLVISQNMLREFMFAPGNPWEASFITRIRQGNITTQEGVLFSYREALLIDSSKHTDSQSLSTAAAFVRHGISHILTGYDHLLFVGALVFVVTRWQYLLTVIAIFTLAHTLTLTLSALAIVRLSSLWVEPIIAASIVAVALQNCFWAKHSQGRLRLVMAFGFGLFHGLGFAGGLLTAMSGLTSQHWVIALLSFSLGVECGHLLVVLPVFYGLMYLRRLVSLRRMEQLQDYGSLVIALLGLVYFYAAIQAI